MPRVAGSRVELTVLWKGKPLAGAEVVVAGPGISTLKEPSDSERRVAATLGENGLYSVRAKHIEAARGISDGKEYGSIRHYSTLTVSVNAAAKSVTADKNLEFPPLPVAVSSFCAAVADGFVYVYGGIPAKRTITRRTR